jgi:hypothetical protein
MATIDHDRRAVDPQELSMADLFRRLSDDASTLVRQEIELAKEEMTEKAKVAGKGAGMFGGAAVAALAALGALTACLIWALSEVMPGAVAALIVTIVWLAIAAVLALAGRARVRAATPLAPRQAQEGLKKDVRAAREGLRAGRAGEIETTGGTR